MSNPFDQFAQDFSSALPNGELKPTVNDAPAPYAPPPAAAPAPAAPRSVMNAPPQPMMQQQPQYGGNNMYGGPPPAGMNGGPPPPAPYGMSYGGAPPQQPPNSQALVPTGAPRNPYAIGGGPPPPFGQQQPPPGSYGQPPAAYGAPPPGGPPFGGPPQAYGQPPAPVGAAPPSPTPYGQPAGAPPSPARPAPPGSASDPFGAPAPYGAPPPGGMYSAGAPPEAPPAPVADPYNAAPGPQDPWASMGGGPPPAPMEQSQALVPSAATDDDPFGIFSSGPPPPAAAPQMQPPQESMPQGSMVVSTPNAASAAGGGDWGDMGFGSPEPMAPVGGGEVALMDGGGSVNGGAQDDGQQGEGDLPPGGEWYDARIFTPTLGVMFFKPQELTDSLFLQTDKSLVDSLHDRPVVAFIVEGSSARSAGVELGHVLLKVNGIDVKNPKEASRLIKEGPRPLPLLFYVPDTTVVVAEGEHMVKYDTRETGAPNSAKDWKPKYVVVGGIIAQPWMMNMYRSKSEYDIAVIETQARRPVSVKGPQMVKYKNKLHPWKYIVVLPVSRNPIKISSPNLSQLKPVHEGIRRVLMAQQRDRGGGAPNTAAPMRHADPYGRSPPPPQQQQQYNNGGGNYPPQQQQQQQQQGYPPQQQQQQHGYPQQQQQQQQQPVEGGGVSSGRRTVEY
eukprot:scaffold11078_cov48-Attheya_sp.AAC.4